MSKMLGGNNVPIAKTNVAAADFRSQNRLRTRQFCKHFGTVTGNNQYDVYYGGKESSAPELTVSGSVKAGYYTNNDWKLPILVSGALSEDSVIRVGVYEGIKPGYGKSLAIAEPAASGVTLSAENFKADAADSVTSLGEDGKVYLSLCEHEMDDTGYTCKKCHTQFDARIGESAYYQTLAKAFQNAWDGSTISGSLDTSVGERPPRGRLKRRWRMRQDHLCGKPPHQRRPNKVQSGSHPSIKQPVAGCFALRQDSAGVLPDPRRQSSNDTPVQPQPQAVGAARRDPRRGEIPVTRARAVQACRLRLGK